MIYYKSDKSDGLRVPFGRCGSDGRISEPLEVPLGKACGCVCPGCGKPLIARHCVGSSRIPHFAHQPGVDCSLGYVTALHEAAIQLILDRMELYVPACPPIHRVRDALGVVHSYTRTIAPAQLLRLSKATKEQPIGNVIPDILAESEIGRLNIEVAVTHFVDLEKLEKLRQLNLATVELNLSKLDRVNFEILGNLLFSPNDRIRWVYHPETARHVEQAQEALAPVFAEAEIAAKEQQDEWEAQHRVLEAARREQERGKLAREKELRLARNEELKRAAKFRSLSEEQKLARVLSRLGIHQPPAYLALHVRGGDSFGVINPFVWQLTMVGGLIHKAVEAGHPGLKVDTTAEWLASRFNVVPVFPNANKVAIWDYLVGLEKLRVLSRARRGYFRILVAGLETLSNLVEHRKMFLAAPTVESAESWLEWAPEDQWPDPKISSELAKAHAEVDHWYSPETGWARLATLVPRARRASVADVIAHYERDVAPRLILEYLLAAGFLRMKEQPTS